MANRDISGDAPVRATETETDTITLTTDADFAAADAELLKATAAFWTAHDDAGAAPEVLATAGNAVVALPARTVAGVLAKAKMVQEAIEGGCGVWDRALAAGLVQDVEAMVMGATA